MIHSPQEQAKQWLKSNSYRDSGKRCATCRHAEYVSKFEAGVYCMKMVQDTGLYNFYACVDIGHVCDQWEKL